MAKNKHRMPEFYKNMNLNSKAGFCLNLGYRIFGTVERDVMRKSIVTNLGETHDLRFRTNGKSKGTIQKIATIFGQFF